MVVFNDIYLILDLIMYIKNSPNKQLWIVINQPYWRLLKAWKPVFLWIKGYEEGCVFIEIIYYICVSGERKLFNPIKKFCLPSK